MGWLDRLLGRGSGQAPYGADAAQRVFAEPWEPFVGYNSAGIPVADPGVPLHMLRRGDIEAMWRTQPNVRKVIDFIARNTASIPLRVHERVSDTDRQRVRNHPLDAVMRSPRPKVGAYQFWHALISDGLLYDRWAFIVQPTNVGGFELVQVPSWRLRFEVDALRRVRRALCWVGDQDQDVRRDSEDGWQELDLDLLVFAHGYAPATAGLSPMETLADMLAESAEAVRYRRQVWANGARVPAYVYRPAGAPPWSQQARERFQKSFRAAYAQSRGSQAGGVPLFEDGMELRPVDAFKPQDTMDLEGRRLTAIEVAAAFHIAPELVGAQQGNYSNVREYRQMLYRDSLGPYIKAIEDALNAQLVPMLAGDRALYVEANVESKLRGDFIEQAQVKQSATGAPWLTRNEARALENRPPLPGGDDLVVPLNVLIGGQASPRDSGLQNRGEVSRRPAAKAGGALVKATAPDAYVTRIRGILSDFFDRQGRVVKSRLGAGDDWWDQDRWDKELTDDLFRVAVLVSTYVGEGTAEEIGFEPSQYDVDRTLAYLKAVSERIAGQVNTTTYAAVLDALEDDEDPDAAVDHVFEVAAESRADQSARTVTTTFAAFAAVEAAQQLAPSRARKRWQVNSSNPRSSHAAINGEEVPLDEPFSNGLMWPGSFDGDVDEIAGCQCSIAIVTD